MRLSARQRSASLFVTQIRHFVRSWRCFRVYFVGLVIIVTKNYKLCSIDFSSRLWTISTLLWSNFCCKTLCFRDLCVPYNWSAWLVTLCCWIRLIYGGRQVLNQIGLLSVVCVCPSVSGGAKCE